MIQVRIKKDMELGAPGLSSGVRLREGQLVCIWGAIDRPGHVLGIHTLTEWTFWQIDDIDESLIFHPNDLSEIIVTEDDPRRDLLQNAPVPVTAIPRAEVQR